MIKKEYDIFVIGNENDFVKHSGGTQINIYIFQRRKFYGFNRKIFLCINHF